MKTPEEIKEYKRQWRIKNKERLDAKNKLNKDELSRKRKEKYKENSEKLKEKRREYYAKNKEKELTRSKKYNEKNRDKILIKKKEYRDLNKDLINNKKKEWDSNNRDKINEYVRNKRNTDEIFKLTSNCRSLIRKAIKRNGYTKKTKTHDILGCSYNEFKEHLELLWSHPNNLDENGNVWMNWDNYGLYNGEPNHGWDIDHIIPLSTAITEESVIKLNHYTNLQPLCSYINRDVKIDNYNNL